MTCNTNTNTDTDTTHPSTPQQAQDESENVKPRAFALEGCVEQAPAQVRLSLIRRAAHTLSRATAGSVCPLHPDAAAPPSALSFTADTNAAANHTTKMPTNTTAVAAQNALRKTQVRDLKARAPTATSLAIQWRQPGSNACVDSFRYEVFEVTGGPQPRGLAPPSDVDKFSVTVNNLKPNTE